VKNYFLLLLLILDLQRTLGYKLLGRHRDGHNGVLEYIGTALLYGYRD